VISKTSPAADGEKSAFSVVGPSDPPTDGADGSLSDRPPAAATPCAAEGSRFGTVAPGPRADLFVPPGPRELLDVPVWDWHRLGVDGKRQRAIRAAATVARRLEECVAMPPAAAMTRLRAVPGVGEWTAAETALRAFGDPDAVSVGDFHLANLVVHALTGRARGTDAEMLDLLAPWSGQRARVVRLIELSGLAPPKFGPRFAPNDIRRI